ncbi:hypothetical protein HYC85_013155 [Camellia sinensis]|uniref:ABC transmembrane type-1 domain-containing protein n=1 Tax=Camellia sinensis TaxID=4442 RepID=A0A7J7H673_CAMSI|nr:hypothetical protein HYC85_013155 [Camellia sinensis]
MEAELIALATANDEANWLRDLLNEIFCWEKPIPPILIHCDSTAAIGRVNNRYYNDPLTKALARDRVWNTSRGMGLKPIEYSRSYLLEHPLQNSPIIDELYAALQGEEVDTGDEINMDDNVTPFAKAGFLSRLSFWWSNPLLKKGKDKILEDKEIPKLRQTDQAETCYFRFMEQLSKQKEKGTPNPPILSTIFFWQWKAILVSGFFALIKVLTLATSPMLLKAFIEVAQGKETFKYEGYAITAESLSQRQWYFQTRVIGLQVRSLLSVAIYKKQLRLSNAAMTIYSPAEITNYVTVDAYRIGEFPYWFHQIWTTPLQICLAILIIYYSIGLATIAALIVIILIALGNYPIAKLHHKHQTNLSGAQGRRLKAITETLTNMKILKLHAWENHFKNVIESLRRNESNYLSAVLSIKGYGVVLFWSSTTLVSIVTFWACYFLKIPLNYSN